MTESDDHDRGNGKPPQMKIRNMEIDDIAKVFHLGERLFEAQSLKNLYRTWDEFEVVELYLGDSEFCLVAELEDEIVGFALGTTISKSRSAWKYGHLIWLGVDEKRQRLGVAEKLFNKFRSMMIDDGVRMLIVDSQAGNHPGIGFFKKMGFTNPIEHIYMSMNLTDDRQRKAPPRSPKNKIVKRK